MYVKALTTLVLMDLVVVSSVSLPLLLLDFFLPVCLVLAALVLLSIKTKEKLLVVLMNEGKMTIQMIGLYLEYKYNPYASRMKFANIHFIPPPSSENDDTHLIRPNDQTISRKSER